MLNYLTPNTAAPQLLVPGDISLPSSLQRLFTVQSLRANITQGLRANVTQGLRANVTQGLRENITRSSLYSWPGQFHKGLKPDNLIRTIKRLIKELGQSC